MNPIFDRHFDELARRLEEVTKTPLPSGSVLIRTGEINLPQGWNRPYTTVRFIAPAGYPFSPPDCFWGDEGLALESGLAPQSTNNQPVPETNEPGTWFSWHVQQWNPNKDSLLTFFRLIEQRLRQAQ